MAISKFQNFEILIPKISENLYFWENLYKFQLKKLKKGKNAIEPHVYYLPANF